MLKWFLEIDEICDAILINTNKALELFDDARVEETDPPEDKISGVNDVIAVHCKRLQSIWPEDIAQSRIGDLRRHVSFGHEGDYGDIKDHDIPDIKDTARGYAKSNSHISAPLDFEALLHPMIAQKSLSHYNNGDYRNAVLDGVISIFDLIRERTGRSDDGTYLVNEVFKLSDPTLVFSEVETETGQSDQKGFMEIFRGVYQGVRNPKAHTLNNDLTDKNAAQYLVMLSLLARRVDEAILGQTE